VSDQEPYTIDLTRAARRALAESLPLDVVHVVTEFFAGPLASNPHRVGKELDVPMKGIHSARVMREWRVLYKIDSERRVITVQSILHRRDAYRVH
jgi:mRNA interferase RelE/StbE